MVLWYPSDLFTGDFNACGVVIRAMFPALIATYLIVGVQFYTNNYLAQRCIYTFSNLVRKKYIFKYTNTKCNIFYRVQYIHT